MIYKLIIFLVLNFAALGIGSLLMGGGPTSEWYMNLNKAPWTPPGWFFGVAWTTIMICFAFYMAHAWETVSDRKFLLGLFIAQWVLNVSWNPVFFKYHQILLALVVIILLTLLIGYFLFKYRATLGAWSLLILPYFLWLITATSLNAYALTNNG